MLMIVGQHSNLDLKSLIDLDDHQESVADDLDDYQESVADDLDDHQESVAVHRR
jgi:hypothetical protein